QDPAWACRKLFDQLGSEHKQFINLGREQGFADNFGHVEMLVSKAAQAEVWPLVARWLADQQTPLPGAEADLAAVI
ncbi:alpha/beta hydrolase, partial [Pseudomonas sp. HMWF031]